MFEKVANLLSEEFFIAGITIVFVAAIVFFFRKKKTEMAITYSSCDDLKPARSRARKVTVLILLLFFSSIAGTSFLAVDKGNDSSSSGDCRSHVYNRRDTMIIQDVSGSMSDTGDKKFQLARSATLRTLGANPDENMGFVLFSTIAFAPIAPTNCHALFSSFTDEDFYETDLLKDLIGGTDGSAALRIAQQMLELSDARNKRIVFIGDLEDNDQDGFIATIRDIIESGIEVKLIGIKTGQYYYQDLKAYGLNTTFISNEADAEELGPLPQDLAEKDNFHFTSQLNQRQKLTGWIVLVSVALTMGINFYVRRQFGIRIKKRGRL